MSRDRPYQPYHEVQAMADGPVAAALGELARERWKAFGDRSVPAVSPSSENLWPSSVSPDLSDVNIAISRTLGADGDTPAVRECEMLFVDSIAAAQKLIYIESQYFTNETIGNAIAKRLQEPDGPEIIIVSPEECSGWLEKQTIGAFRVRAFQALIAADKYKRLRLVYPVASRSAECATFIHSKVMIVDDWFVRIGSANLSNRSMFLDSECDLAIDASDDVRARKGIAGIRNRLIGEHMGIPAGDVDARIAEAGSLRSLIDKCRGADRTLTLIEISPEEESAATDLLRAVVDPAEPAPVEPAGRRPRHRAAFG
jgi:phosphatidylserine/phosphatidylglycerophosphate/cardiolipin synthase-like enzyme